MKEKEFYQRLLGVEAPWKVIGVELDWEHQRIEVEGGCEPVEWVEEGDAARRFTVMRKAAGDIWTPANVRGDSGALVRVDAGAARFDRSDSDG